MRMEITLAAALLGAAGCDRVFGLAPVDRDGGAGSADAAGTTPQLISYQTAAAAAMDVPLTLPVAVATGDRIIVVAATYNTQILSVTGPGGEPLTTVDAAPNTTFSGWLYTGVTTVVAPVVVPTFTVHGDALGQISAIALVYRGLGERFTHGDLTELGVQDSLAIAHLPSVIDPAPSVVVATDVHFHTGSASVAPPYRLIAMPTTSEMLVPMAVAVNDGPPVDATFTVTPWSASLTQTAVFR
jgi:hypothetical protein